MALIALEGVRLAYGARTVLDGISLSIRPGERLAILGGNGSGKSSLCQILAGWSARHRAEGRILWQGRPAADWSAADRVTAVQMVGQIPAQHLSGRAFTVIEEVAFGPENLGLPLPEIRRRVEAALELTRLGGLAGRNPFTLSGGEQQRLVIAAVLALEPKVLVLDEPLTNLDPETHEAMTAVLEALPPELALVLAETDPGLAARLTQTAIHLQGGRIVASGRTGQVLRDPGLVETLGLPPMTAALVAALAAAGDATLPPDLPLVEAELAPWLQRFRHAGD